MDQSVDDLIGALEPPGVLDGLTREEREDEFLRLLGMGCTVREAARAVALSFAVMYRKRREDAAFAKRWDDAQRVKVNHLVAEAERRAMKGSDKLLMFLLTNYAPDKFKRSSSLEITNPDGSLAGTDMERAARVQTLMATARARKAAMAVEDLL